MKAAFILLLSFSSKVLADVDFPEVKAKHTEDHSCFCKLGGEVDDCSCTVESVDAFNNKNIFPRLTSILEKDYFKYYQVDLQQPCLFWKPNGHCMLKDCGVRPCKKDEVPKGLKNSSGGQNAGSHQNKYSREAQSSESCLPMNETEEELSRVDMTISDKSNEAFKNWTLHDDQQSNFCELDDEMSPTLEYVNLLLNPEGFTGYSGPDAHKIWNSIYDENCFIEKPKDRLAYGFPTGNTCLEKRTFYRMVSGLHTSINTHLSAKYFFPKKNAFDTGYWGMNAEEFYARFDPKRTNGMGPIRLRNLYFTYLVELRALAKAAPYLKQELYYTGGGDEDRETSKAVSQLLDSISEFPDHFDESKLFQGEASELKEEFRLKFLNISRIMDCVGCDKCKLWGKVQVRGMGTALKILFSGESMSPFSTVMSSKSFHLTRVEIVSLFNAFGRLSNSIKYIEDFRQQVP